MADTLGALVMSESWFEHRAITVNQRGNRDLGVAQACDATRRRMTALYHAGAVDVLLEDDDYFDPWKGTRFLAVWMGLLLDEVNGDLDAAVAAYHRGAARAHDRRGREYLDMVKRRLHRFLRNQDAPEAWGDLWRRDAASAARMRPWLRGAEETRHVTGADQPAGPGRRSPSAGPAARLSIGGE